MKNARISLVAIAIATAGLFAFSGVKTGSIKGMVNPADGAIRAWALSSSDTLRADVNKGTFEITDAKPGTYRVIIEAKPPYKNAAKDGVTVTDGQATDVGEIKLEQ
jgi:hypothetical protein